MTAPKLRTYCLGLFTRDYVFLGGVIFDHEVSPYDKPVHFGKALIEPHVEKQFLYVVHQDITGAPKVKERHKNRLLDEAEILTLGRRVPLAPVDRS
jgi:hypothetical protein